MGSVDGSLENFGVRGRVINVRGVFSISSEENAEKRREKRVKRERRRKEGEGVEAMAVHVASFRSAIHGKWQRKLFI